MVTIKRNTKQQRTRIKGRIETEKNRIIKNRDRKENAAELFNKNTSGDLVEESKAIIKHEKTEISTNSLDSQKVVDEKKIANPTKISTNSLDSQKVVDEEKVMNPTIISTKSLDSQKVVDDKKVTNITDLSCPQEILNQIVTPESTNSLDPLQSRKKSLLSFADTPNIPVFSKSFHTLLLPKPLLRLSRLSTAILSVFKFNSIKNINTIYHKSKKCLENIISSNVSIADFERLNFIAPSLFEFKLCKIVHLGNEINSFEIKMTKESVEDVSIGLKEFYERKKIEVDKMRIEMICRMKTNNKLKSNILNENEVRNYEDTTLDITVPRKKLIEEDFVFDEKGGYEESSSQDLKIETKPIENKRASSILERIKDREKKRREAFIEQSIKDEEELKTLKNKMKTFFKVERVKSVELLKLGKMMGISKWEEKIERVVKESPKEFRIEVFGVGEFKRYLIYLGTVD